MRLLGVLGIYLAPPSLLQIDKHHPFSCLIYWTGHGWLVIGVVTALHLPGIYQICTLG